MIDQDILKLCIKVNGMKAFFPQFGQLDETPLEPSVDTVGTYGWNNGVVAFVTPDGSYYVSPFCVEVADYLNKNGYRNAYIYVPFSNMDEPSDRIQAQAWKKLCIEAKELHNRKEKERRREEVRKIARERGIRELDPSVYEMSLQIPDTGLRVKHYTEEESITNPIPEFSLRNAVGTYYQNNGRVVFVDDKGETYVTPYCHEVKIQLANAGYSEGSLFVPLSNGEEIVDEALKEKWAKLCMNARELSNERQKKEKANRILNLAISKGLDALPEDAYKLTLKIPEEGLETLWLGDRHQSTRPISEWELNDTMGTYCQNNGRVVFVDDKGETHVTPFCAEMIALLRTAGYKERSLYVPLSNGEVPADEMLKLKWKQLCGLARKSFEKREAERKKARLQKLAQNKGIKELPSTIYRLSFKIPENGMDTLFLGTEKDITRPIYDWELETALGSYCQNNGRIVFVDANGETYVSPHCQEVAAILEEAGYTPGSLFVPLSNGEEIVNEELKAQWQELCARLPEVGSGPKL